MSLEHNTPIPTAFLTLHLTGCAIFTFMLVSAFLSPTKIKRHPIWHNFCLSFVVFSLSYSLLAFVPPSQRNNLELKGSGFCVAQAAFIYSAPFLAPSASAALVALLLHNIVSTLSGETRKASPASLTIALASPWVLWSTVLLGATALIVGDVSMAELSPNGTFCILTHSALPRVSAAAAAIFALAILAFELWIAYLLWKHRAADHVFRESIAMAVRTAILTTVAVAAVATGFLSAGMDHKPVLDIMIAIVPFATSITFATQRDLWRRYMFWKKDEHPEPADGKGIGDDSELRPRNSDLESPGFISVMPAPTAAEPVLDLTSGEEAEKGSWGYSAAMSRRFSGTGRLKV